MVPDLSVVTVGRVKKSSNANINSDCLYLKSNKTTFPINFLH